MTEPTTCPTCRQTRVPGARYCYHCGRSFLTGEAATMEPIPGRLEPGQTKLAVPFAAAVTLGFGFTLGAAIFSSVVGAILVGLGSIFLYTT